MIAMETIPPVAISVLIALIASTILLSVTFKESVPRGVVWIDKRDEFLSGTRSKLRAFFKGRNLFYEAYINYSTKGQFSMISSISVPLVMVPLIKLGWFFKQKDRILDHRATGFDAVETYYTMPCGHILDDPSHISILNSKLTPELGNLTLPLVEEIENGLKDLWGRETEHWQEIDLWDTIMSLVTRSFGRVLVDKPLCEDKQYLYNTRRYVSSIHATSAIIRTLPSWTKPVLGRILSLPCWYYYWRGKQQIIPFIEACLAEGYKELEGEEFKSRNTLVMWMIRTALKTQKPLELHPETIYARLMTLNFAGIHTSTFTIVNCLLDTLSEPNVFQQITNETVQVYHYYDQNWTKAAIDDLKFLDRAIRESIRLSGPIVRLLREVAPESGINIDGVNLPKGTKVAANLLHLHHDNTIYKNAKKFDVNRLAPFNKGEMPPLVTTSEHFLGFGHGRNACPGRFFASHEIKIIVGLIALRYNIKPLASRPHNIWMGDSLIPPSFKLRVKYNLAKK